LVTPDPKSRRRRRAREIDRCGCASGGRHVCGLPGYATSPSLSALADPKPRREADDSDAQERRDFKVAVLAADRGCVVHDDPLDCDGPLQAHHVVSQQRLRRTGRLDLAWDPANGASVCERAHTRHTLGVERIALSRLPARCVSFAAVHGFGYVLERTYGRDV
jgi:hypothetical protein